MCIPTILAYATEEQKTRYAVPALEGKEIWCQLFSEPSAGSDLAGLRTRCIRDGDDWIINGQKIWTSGAHFSDFGVIVVRSDTNAPKHKGLTYFFLDMKSPGIEVRRIKQVSGVSNFNEVFFNNVRVPDAQRLSEPAEIALSEAIIETAGAIAPAIAKGDYAAALRALAGLRPVVDGFFDEVMVMAPDPGVRANRLALLGQLNQLFLGIADISLLQTRETGDG